MKNPTSNMRKELATPVEKLPFEAWRRRLYLPNYQVKEAARYAGISTQTVVSWQTAGERQAVAARRQREALSYMQLIEVAVVAALRKEGVTAKVIRGAREYAAKQLQSEFPFAEYRFKTDGRTLFMDYEQIEGKVGRGKLLRPERGGQLAWANVIGRLKEFEYEKNGIVVQWHVAGRESSVLIDPRISFGAPTISGVPTWVISGRWRSGEDIADIRDDFGLGDKQVRDALSFEGVADAVTWTH